MSIEMETPQTPLEIIDAARNWNAQIRIASMVGDNRRVEMAINKIESLLFALQEAQEHPAAKISEGRRVACLHAKEMIELLANKKKPSQVSYIALLQTLASCAKP